MLGLQDKIISRIRGVNVEDDVHNGQAEMSSR